MLYTLFIVAGVVITTLLVLFTQILSDGHLIWWTIPLYLIGSYLLTVLIFVVVSCLISIIIPKDKADRTAPKRFYRNITYQCCNYCLKLGRVVPVIKHARRIDCDSFMLVSNHQSLIDPLAILWAFRDKNITFVMKKEVLDLPFVGGWLRRSGFLALDRSNNRSAVKTIKTAASRIADGKYSIGVFPEGTRSKGPNLGEFKHGSFKIAEWSKCPIVVVSIDNAYKIKYHSPFKKNKILIEVLRVIKYEEYKDLNTSEISDLCSNIIKEGIERRRSEYEWLKAKTVEELESETIIGSFKKKQRKK